MYSLFYQKQINKQNPLTSQDYSIEKDRDSLEKMADSRTGEEEIQDELGES